VNRAKTHRSTAHQNGAQLQQQCAGIHLHLVNVDDVPRPLHAVRSGTSARGPLCCANSPPALLFSYLLFSSRGEKKAPVRRVADTQSQWGRAAAAVQVLKLPPSRRVAKLPEGRSVHPPDAPRRSPSSTGPPQSPGGSRRVRRSRCARCIASELSGVPLPGNLLLVAGWVIAGLLLLHIRSAAEEVRLRRGGETLGALAKCNTPRSSPGSAIRPL